jgi:hypothetical protein
MVPNVITGQINIFHFIHFAVKSAVWTQFNLKVFSEIDPCKLMLTFFAVAVAE